jgi:hypothetical protein
MMVVMVVVGRRESFMVVVGGVVVCWEVGEGNYDWCVCVFCCFHSHTLTPEKNVISTRLKKTL